jgi:DNA adenine methylase
MRPIFKWTGGKRREIKIFEPFYPSFIKTSIYNYVEPFVGGGAVYFHIENFNGENIINDYDSTLINFYRIFQEGNYQFVEELKRISKITEHDELEKEYYRLRNQDKNNGVNKLSDIDNAIRFFVINQLAFSGMRRFNSSGEFNVPFGHYKRLNADIINSESHQNLLKKTKIYNEDFEIIIKNNDRDNTFIFLDPPYTKVFKEYTSNNSFGNEDHCRLKETIDNVKKASIMMIIDRSDFTEKLYRNKIVKTYSLSYGVNIKNRFTTKSEHLIITNY